jgi:cation:H+ antiporter
MVTTVLLLIASAIAIYFSCEYFVNAVEWVGLKLNITKNATGTILAAIGTALPESVITFVAVVFGNNSSQKEIGIGAAIGGPLVLATIAYSIVGIFFILNKKQDKKITSKFTELRLGYDQIWFIKIFICITTLGLVTFGLKPWLGLVFLAAYGIYAHQEMKGTDDPEHLDFIEPLKIKPNNPNPTLAWILLQISFALIVIFISSRTFVHQLVVIGSWLSLPPQLVALLLSPVATELPEVMNAIIWVRQGKQILALANISGAMMIQTTIPCALGLLFTPWILNRTSLWSAIITILAMLNLYLLLKRDALTASRLSYIGLYYILFLLGLCGLYYYT